MIYEDQMERKGLKKTDLARLLGAKREGVPPEQVDPQKYISHVNNFLNKPLSATMRTYKEFGKLLDVEIQLVAKVSVTESI